MIKILFCIFSFLSLPNLNTFGQEAVGIVCTDFTINNEKRDEGAEFRKSLESVLSNLKYPPILIDRDRISDLIQEVQEEINLKKDLNISQVSKLVTAKVDYLMYENLNRTLISKTYDLQIECIKVAGDNAFSKIAFPIMTLTEKELANGEIFRKRLSTMLDNYAFNSDFGIIQNDLLVKINKRLDEKEGEIKDLDSTVGYLKTDAIAKNGTINNLSISISEIQKDNIIKDNRIKELDSTVKSVKDSVLFKEKYLYDLKHKVPSADITLNLDSIGNIYSIVQLLNDVPIEYKVIVNRYDNKSMISNFIVLRDPKLYPSKKYAGVINKEDNINNGQYPKDSIFKIRVKFTFHSIYMEETNLAELAKEINKVFIINRNNNTISEIKE